MGKQWKQWETLFWGAMAPHSSTLAWKIPWTEEPGRLRSMGSRRVRHDWATSLSLFTFMHWRRKGQHTPVFLPGESQGRGAWWAAVYGVTQSRTRLKRLSSSSSKGTFHAKMGSIKDRNGIDLTEAEDIKKRWQEYTEELYRKGTNDTDNHNGVITHLKTDVLQCECKVKWALGIITANQASRFPAELFQDLKEAEDIKKRWQEYTKELYKKDLHDQDNHDGVITHLSQTSCNVKSSGP